MTTTGPLSWTTDRGADVTVRGEDGSLLVDVEAPGVSLSDAPAQQGYRNGLPTLDLGIHEVGGSETRLQIPAGDRESQIEQLKLDSIDRERTDEERAALDEAAETGERVVIDQTTIDCRDPGAECSADRVTRVATPEGEIESRTTHLH